MLTKLYSSEVATCRPIDHSLHGVSLTNQQTEEREEEEEEGKRRRRSEAGKVGRSD